MSAGAKIMIQKLRDRGLAKRIMPDIDLSSRTVNGVGSYVPAICKLVLFYNPPRPGAGGDCIGLVDYINRLLPTLASQRPYVEIVLEKRSGPAEIEAYYNNGKINKIFVRRWKTLDIALQIERLCDSTGLDRKKHFGNVLKGTGSKIDQLKSHWDPFHADHIFRP